MQSRVVVLAAFLLKGAMILLAIFAAAICVGLARAGFASLSGTGIPVNSFMAGNPSSTILLLVAVVVNIYIFKNMQNLISNFKNGRIFIGLNVKYLDSICTLIINLKLLLIAQAFFGVSEPSFQFVEDFYGSWLGILMAFIFARVFEEGVRLNDEAQLTV